MRRLYPDPADPVDQVDAYAFPVDAPRHVRVNMVASVDGAAALAGRVAGLSSPADHELLELNRGLADVLLVGAGTVRAEGYGPLRVSERWQQRRVADGQAVVPRLAVISGSLALDYSSAAFAEASARPLIITTQGAPRDRLGVAESVADVVKAGLDRVDMAAAINSLVERGLTRILCEGGPHLLAELLASGQVDELCLTVSPLVVSGREIRIAAGALLPVPTELTLAHVLEEAGSLFLRYTRAV